MSFLADSLQTGRNGSVGNDAFVMQKPTKREKPPFLKMNEENEFPNEDRISLADSPTHARSHAMILKNITVMKETNNKEKGRNEKRKWRRNTDEIDYGDEIQVFHENSSNFFSLSDDEYSSHKTEVPPVKPPPVVLVDFSKFKHVQIPNDAPPLKIVNGLEKSTQISNLKQVLIDRLDNEKKIQNEKEKEKKEKNAKVDNKQSDHNKNLPLKQVENNRKDENEKDNANILPAPQLLLTLEPNESGRENENYEEKENKKVKRRVVKYTMKVKKGKKKRKSSAKPENQDKKEDINNDQNERMQAKQIKENEVENHLNIIDSNKNEEVIVKNDNKEEDKEKELMKQELEANDNMKIKENGNRVVVRKLKRAKRTAKRANSNLVISNKLIESVNESNQIIEREININQEEKKNEEKDFEGDKIEKENETPEEEKPDENKNGKKTKRRRKTPKRRSKSQGKKEEDAKDPNDKDAKPVVLISPQAVLSNKQITSSKPISETPQPQHSPLSNKKRTKSGQMIPHSKSDSIHNKDKEKINFESENISNKVQNADNSAKISSSQSSGSVKSAPVELQKKDGDEKNSSFEFEKGTENDEKKKEQKDKKYVPKNISKMSFKERIRLKQVSSSTDRIPSIINLSKNADKDDSSSDPERIVILDNGKSSFLQTTNDSLIIIGQMPQITSTPIKKSPIPESPKSRKDKRISPPNNSNNKNTNYPKMQPKQGLPPPPLDITRNPETPIPTIDPQPDQTMVEIGAKVAQSNMNPISICSPSKIASVLYQNERKSREPYFGTNFWYTFQIPSLPEPVDTSIQINASQKYDFLQILRETPKIAN